MKVTELTNDVDKVDGIEAKWVSIQHRKLPSLIVGCFYRHPKSSVDTFIYILDSFKTMILRNKPILAFGDFNDDLLMRGNKMSRILSNVKLKQLVTKPTRITPNSASLIDLVITNNENMLRHFDVIPSPIADHEAITVCLDISKPKRIPVLKTFRCLKNYSQEILCNLLMNEVNQLNGILHTDNVSTQVAILTDFMIISLDKCAPLVTREIT